MCRNRVLAATALLAVLTAQPALALGWGRSAKADKPAAPAPAAAAVASEAPPAKATAQERAMIERMDPLARAAFWAREVNKDAADAEAGIHLAAALRAMGNHADAAQAAQRVVVLQPANVEALLEVARVYIAQNQGFYAIEPARKAQGLAPRDWRAASLLGVALEQAERDDEALAAHRQAVALAPTNPVALSNAAMFYAGHGDRTQAEALLRQAAALPGATIQIRQNLALVVGLQGRIAEAEQLARQDLPPAQVANNLAYLRAATGSAGQDRSWSAVR